jgi:hypothetical protein
MEFKTIPINGLEKYEINKEGDVRNKKTQRILKPQLIKNKYKRVNLINSNGKQNQYYIEFLVWYSFKEI